ncbi:MAG: LacI family transcriptional regulator [Pelagimonas sp.]|uniref:LacI family transcriptional regulator n=1 Tax=Pelagimonas sp. TaxID=2073170 RepID=UPI003D6A6CCA
MNKSRRPTLKTIAKLTGLAVPTVSRALSGAEDIGQNTRERVRKVADEIGYVPNRAGLRLRTGRTFVLTLVLHTEADVMNLTARLINGAASALRSTRYHLNITPYFPGEDPMRPIRHIVETHAADAIIMNQTQPDDPRVRYLLDKGFPFATHGRSNWSEQHAYYDFDNYTYGQLAVKRLAGLGRKSIRVVAPPMDQNYGQELVAGASAKAEELGVDLHVMKRVTSDDSAATIEQEIADLFSEHVDTDGMIFASANSCMASVTGLERAGLTIGKDIDLFSKEALPFLQRFRPAIHSQHEEAWAAGDFLARAAIERIEKPDNPLMQFLEVPE